MGVTFPSYSTKFIPCNAGRTIYVLREDQPIRVQQYPGQGILHHLVEIWLLLPPGYHGPHRLLLGGLGTMWFHPGMVGIATATHLPQL